MNFKKKKLILNVHAQKLSHFYQRTLVATSLQFSSSQEAIIDA